MSDTSYKRRDNIPEIDTMSKAATMHLSERADTSGGEKIEVTVAMIDAGVDAWYGEVFHENAPCGDNLRNVLREVFVAMAQADRCASVSISPREI